MLTVVSREVEFDAAHRLLDSPESKCYETHGHRYRVIVYVTGFLNDKGEVIDFGELKRILFTEIHNPLDHNYVNTVIKETNATVERMLEWCWPRVASAVALKGVILTKMEIYETPTCKAERVLPAEYLASAIDMDGSISQTGNIDIQTRVSNTDVNMLQSLMSDLGCGTVQKGGSGKGIDGYKPNKPCRQLVIPQRMARVLCALCLPYLRIKREQAEVCVEYGRYEKGKGKVSLTEWNRRAALLTRLSKANGHNRTFTGEGLMQEREHYLATYRRKGAPRKK